MNQQKWPLSQVHVTVINVYKACKVLFTLQLLLEITQHPF